jgi:hypothetical protein
MCKGGDQHRLEQHVELACVQPAETWARVHKVVEANVLCHQADVGLLNVHQVNVFEHVFQLYGVQQGRLEQLNFIIFLLVICFLFINLIYYFLK